jgi:dual specificity phosphatase 12
MGKSRSATVLIAYLLWASRQTSLPTVTKSDDMVPIPSKPLSVVEALMLLRQGRPIVEPNPGFMDQLHMFVDMGCPTTSEEIEKHKLYRRFINRRNVAESLAINRAPDVVDIRFEDDEEAALEDSSARLGSININEHSQDDRPREEVAPGVYAPTGEAGNASATTQLRCRRCRHILASTPHMMAHTPLRSDPASAPCAHIFLHPLSWMRETLAEGQLEGRLACPNSKCGINVGKFAWQGLRCSCGGWVTPGFGVLRGKVDEVADKSGGAQTRQFNSSQQAGGAIRLPPSMRGRGGGNL